MPRSPYSLAVIAAAICATLLGVAYADGAHADEGGVSVWLPRQFGSLAAVPQTPAVYCTPVSASVDAARARNVTIQGLLQSVSVDLNVKLNVKPNADADSGAKGRRP